METVLVYDIYVKNIKGIQMSGFAYLAMGNIFGIHIGTSAGIKGYASLQITWVTNVDGIRLGLFGLGFSGIAYIYQ